MSHSVRNRQTDRCGWFSSLNAGDFSDFRRQEHDRLASDSAVRRFHLVASESQFRHVTVNAGRSRFSWVLAGKSLEGPGSDNES